MRLLRTGSRSPTSAAAAAATTTTDCPMDHLPLACLRCRLVRHYRTMAPLHPLRSLRIIMTMETFIRADLPPKTGHSMGRLPRLPITGIMDTTTPLVTR